MRWLAGLLSIGAAAVLPTGIRSLIEVGDADMLFVNVPSMALTAIGLTLLLRRPLERIEARVAHTETPDLNRVFAEKVAALREKADEDPFGVAIPIVRAIRLATEIAESHAGSLQRAGRRALAIACVLLVGSMAMMVPRIAYWSEPGGRAWRDLAWDVGCGVLFPAFLTILLLSLAYLTSFRRIAAAHAKRLLEDHRT